MTSTGDQMTEKMTTAAAAEWLQSRHPKRSAAAWVQWLANNRNPNRSAAFRVPFVKEAGHVWYSLQALQAILSAEQAIKAGHTSKEATLLQAAGNGLLNRPWPGMGRFYGQADQGGPFVKLAIDSPLQTFRLSLKEAAALMGEIEDAIRNAESIAAELDPNYQPKLKPRQ